MRNSLDEINSKVCSFSEANVFKLLKTFSKKEIIEFSKFVHSGFLNNRSEVADFFDKVKSYHPQFNHEDFSKENIYMRLYPGKQFRDDVIRRLCSNLFKLAEEYLSYTLYKEDKFYQTRNLLREYHMRDLNNFYDKQYAKANLFLESTGLRSAEYFLRSSIVQELNRQHLLRHKGTAKEHDLRNQLDTVWKHSLITLLRLYTVALQHINQFNKKYDLKELNPLKNFIKSHGFLSEKAVEILHLTNNIMSDQRNDKTFYRLKNLLGLNHQILDHSEKDMIFVALLTYCWDMNVKPGKDYSKDEFELITHMIQSGILTEGGRMHSEWFMYAFLTAVKAGEIQFASQFIEDYKDTIYDDEKYNVVNHAYAEVELIKKNYEESLRYLALPRYNYFSEKLRANFMYLKIYYELGRSDQFFYQVDSFKHLLKNQKELSSNLIVVRKKFVEFVYKLYKIKLGEHKTDLSKLKIEIGNSNVFYKKWLTEKVDELLGNMRRQS